MSRHTTTWPIAAIAVAMGVATGVAVAGIPFGGPDRSGLATVDPADGIRSRPAPPARPLPPPRYRPPRVLSNSGTYDALEDLKSPREVIRASGAGRLSLSAEPERVLPALIVALEDDEAPRVRLVAAQAIGRLGAEEGLAPLMRAAANDPSPRVRRMAAEAHDSLMTRVPVQRTIRR